MIKHLILCPNCHGQKTVSKPPYVAGDQLTWASNNAWETYPCPTCNGLGYINDYNLEVEKQ